MTPHDVPAPSIEPPVTLRRTLDVLRNRYMSMVLTTAAAAIIMAFLARSERPSYIATARLLVDPVNYSIQQLDSSNPLSNIIAAGAEHSVATQARIINSSSFLNDVYRSLGIKASQVSEITGVTAGLPEGSDTDVIEINVTGTSPQLAAGVANGAAQHYVARSHEAKLEALRGVRQYLQGQAVEAARALKDATARLVQFRIANQLHPGDDFLKSALQSQMELESEVRHERGEIAAADAELRTLRAQRAAMPREVSASRRATNAEATRLQDQLRQREAELEAAQRLYQPSSPALSDLQEQVAALRSKLAATPTTIVIDAGEPNVERDRLEGRIRELEAERTAREARLSRAETDLAPESRRAVGAPIWSVELDSLTRAKQAAEDADRDVSSKLRELEVRELALPKTVRVLQEAAVPSRPVGRGMLPKVMETLVFGICLGLAVILIQEQLDQGIHSPEEAESATSLPTLGVVPTIPGSRRPTLAAADNDALATECYRALRTALQFCQPEAPLRSLVVTSSRAGEGKTVTAVNLATVMALQGLRVLLVDADLRRPTLHRVFGVESGDGLSEVLAREQSLAAALKPTEVEGLRVLTCGARIKNPAEALGSDRMRQMVDELTEAADIVIFDTPPCLPVTDAEVLASRVDGVLLVIEAGRSSQDAVTNTVDLLRHVRARLLGSVLNKIDQSKKGAYYHYHYYRGGYRYAGGAPERSQPWRLWQRSGAGAPERHDRRS